MWGWIIYLVCVLGPGAESLQCGWSRPPSWHRALSARQPPPGPKVLLWEVMLPRDAAA